MDDRALHIAQFSLDKAAIGVLRIALDGRVLYANHYACSKLGYSPDELLQLSIMDINPTFTTKDWADHIKGFIGKDAPRTFETQHRRKSGATFPVEVTVNYLHLDGLQCFVAFVRDLTDQRLAEAERSRLQQELARSQRMETVGRLAGGVAHDFNNMLSVILGHATLMLDHFAPGTTERDDLEQIQIAAERSSELTRQLLTFARRQASTPRVVDLNVAVSSLSRMLRRLISETIGFTHVAAPQLWPVRIDPAQLDQVLVNLVVNARDAIDGAGTITLETANVSLTPTDAERVRVPAGDWVLLTVRDTGHGMDEQTQARIFEPFFTTKGVGGGTGLGLSTVFGIVAQHDGVVRVESQPGRGATFFVYLRRHVGEPATATERQIHDLVGGTETVLLVEDDRLVLRLMRALVESLGYRVLATDDPHEALELVERGERFDVLLTDVAMPGLDGLALSRKVRALHARVPVVLMSGYAPDLPGAGEQRFLQKPVSRFELAQVLRAALDGPR